MGNQLYVVGLGISSILVTREEIFYTYMPFLAKPNQKPSVVATQTRSQPPQKVDMFFIKLFKIHTPNGW
jgi:hypothetical protein